MSFPVIINGTFVEKDDLSLNRGLLYGDGLFETIRTQQYQPLFFKYHFDRMQRGCRLLGLELPESFKSGYLQEQIGQLTKRMDYPNARMRLTLWRTSPGAYLPDKNSVSWRLSASNLSVAHYQYEKGLIAGIYRENTKSLSPLSSIKSLNTLIYIQAARFAHAMQWDDAILINCEHRTIEGTASGLMLRQGNTWITPPLSEGAVESVMKRVITGLMIQHGIQVKEIPVTEEMLFGSDEILLLNVIRGVMPVHRIGEKVFDVDSAWILTGWLNEYNQKGDS